MPERDKLEDLLERLCVEWGFCLPAEARRRISEMGAVSPETFALAVLRAEGMEPDVHPDWLGRIANRYRDRFAD
jgi:hypothetical protein